MSSELVSTLLVVGDDPSIHELIMAMLAGENWELDSAGLTEMKSRVASRG
jgi:phosphohistidine phosphatase SixA